MGAEDDGRQNKATAMNKRACKNGTEKWPDAHSYGNVKLFCRFRNATIFCQDVNGCEIEKRECSGWLLPLLLLLLAARRNCHSFRCRRFSATISLWWHFRVVGCAMAGASRWWRWCCAAHAYVHSFWRPYFYISFLFSLALFGVSGKWIYIYAWVRTLLHNFKINGLAANVSISSRSVLRLFYATIETFVFSFCTGCARGVLEIFRFGSVFFIFRIFLISSLSSPHLHGDGRWNSVKFIRMYRKRIVICDVTCRVQKQDCVNLPINSYAKLTSNT